MSDRYQFQTERFEAVLKKAAGRTVDAHDLEEYWEDIVTDNSDWALFVTAEDLPALATAISETERGPDPRYGGWHREALKQLAKHDHCIGTIDKLTAERNDVIASIIDARSYLFNDMWEDGVGGLCISTEPLLRELRPSLRDEGYWNPLPTPLACPECETALKWRFDDHEDWCSFDQCVDQLEERRMHLIQSHLHCTQIGQALVAHTTRCLGRVEEISARIYARTQQVLNSQVVRPHEVLPVVCVEDLNVVLDPRDPATLALAIYPQLVDEDYCEGVSCTEPHRACRYLLS